MIPAGGLAAVGSDYATYLTYAEYLTELAELVGGLRIYAPIYRPEHPEYEYFSQGVLDRALCEVVPFEGHGRSEGGTKLLGNYAQQARVLVRDVESWQRLLVYSPSVTAALTARALKRRSYAQCAVYTYVWGDWAELSRHLPQAGLVRMTLNPWQRRWICAQERWLVRRSRTVWVAGPQLRQQYVGLGADVQETTPMIKMAELLAMKPVHAGREPQVLLYVGRMAPGKGLETLLDGLAVLAGELPNITLRMVGSGDRDFTSALMDRATTLGIRERIVLVGVLRNGPALWEEYRRAAAFVLPSMSEGFPRVLYEAMALATPIVTTAVGSIPALLRSGQHAVLIEPGDLSALVAGVREILSSEERGARLAERARRLFEEHFADHDVSKAQRVAETILNGGRPMPV